MLSVSMRCGLFFLLWVVFEFYVGATFGRGIHKMLETLLAGALGVGAHCLSTRRTGELVLIATFVFIIGKVMAEGRGDLVSIRVGKKLRDLPPVYPEISIFKVPIQLRKENVEAYEPQMFAIGPYHRGKARLKAMEELKLRYLQMLLQRRNENVTRYVVAVRAMEKEARKYYAELVSLDSDDFVEMMLVDGFFIVELVRNYEATKLRDDDNPVYKPKWITNIMRRDLLLLENQLPFFVLRELFGMTVMPNQSQTFTQMICDFLKLILPGSMLEPVDHYPHERIKHLLGFTHENWLHSATAMKSNMTNTTEAGNDNHKYELGYMRSATELQKSGVKFRKVKRESMFDISFKNGIMEIHPITIGDRTEPVFRNLIAYEQCLEGKIPPYVFDYVIVMDGLIDSADDVELLVDRGIIINTLGDHEVVANMFNRLCDSVVISGEFNYFQLLKNVDKYCSRTWNTWMATLKQDYFYSPWALVSFLAATVLLLFSFAQTLYTVRSFYK